MTALTPTYGPCYRQGDRLTGPDLTAWAQAGLFLLARHFRQLHRFYGVTEGLVVEEPAAPAGGTGWSVRVEPGLAYDAYGRPLYLPRSGAMLTVPPAGAAMPEGVNRLLVLRGEEPPVGQLGVRVPTPQHAHLALLPVGELPRAWEVPLAGLVWLRGADGKLVPRREESYRLNAGQGFRPPFVAVGVVPPGTTAVSLPGGMGWRLWVDTHAAGFLPDGATGARGREEAPVYLVRLGRADWADAARLLTGKAVLDKDPEQVFAEHAGDDLPLVSVGGARPDGFFLTVRYARPVDALPATPLEVVWVGVERRPFRRPPARPIDRTEGILVDQTTASPPYRWPEFRDGQVLTADALNELQGTLRRLQWLHNRTLHNWGVAEGFAVSPLPDGRGVQVTGGYAVDADGRELIVGATQQFPNPVRVGQAGPDAGQDWWITVAYRDGTATPSGDQSCRREAVPIEVLPEAVVRWRDPQAVDAGEQLRPGYDLILATVRVEQGGVKAITETGRRGTGPQKQPYIYAQRAPLNLSDPNLQPWPSASDPEGYLITVDTAAARFVNTPQYLLTVEQADGSGDDVCVLARAPSIVAATNRNFRLLVPVRGVGREGGLAALARAVLTLLVLFLLVWGGAWLLSPGVWRKLGDSRPLDLTRRALGAALATAGVVGGLYYGSTRRGRQARRGTPGPWYSVVWGYPSGWVVGLSRLLGWRLRPGPPPLGPGEPIPNRTGPGTAVSGVLALVLLVAGAFVSSMPGVVPEWLADQVAQFHQQHSFFGQIFGNGAGMIRVPAVWAAVLAALAYGASDLAGRSAERPALGREGKWWVNLLTWLLRFIPDHLIHGARYFLGLLPSGRSPAAAPADTPGAACDGQKMVLQIAWVGIEV